jgi:hypothetical protein
MRSKLEPYRALRMRTRAVGLDVAPNLSLLVTVALFSLAVVACAPRALDAKQVEDYTTLKLCRSARIHDLTTQQERNGVVGFSFRARLDLTDQCQRSFESQLANLAPVACPTGQMRSVGCAFELGDTGSQMSSHTSVTVSPLRPDGYDIAFWK